MLIENFPLQFPKRYFSKQEKLNARLQKLKARGHDVSKLVHNMQNESKLIFTG